jgi:GNAT superfamily N-acetyltransferase
MTIHFRKATPADWEILKPLMLGLYQEDPSPYPVTPEKIARTLEESSRHPEKLQLIAFESADLETRDRVIGYALLVFYWSNEVGGTVIFIDELFIASTHRGQGIATQFFTWLEQTYTSTAQGFALETTPSNTRARALYEKLGFRPYKNQLLFKRATDHIDRQTFL